MTSNYVYEVMPAGCRHEMPGHWGGAAWHRVPTLKVASFRAESSRHRPQTRVKLLYSEGGLHGLFMVRDRYVRCVRSRFQSNVYKDSCVEFFAQPKADQGYFNFEINCGGALLASYIVNPARIGTGFEEFTPLSVADVEGIQIYHSLPDVVDPETTDKTTWFIEFFIPYTVFEKYVGPLAPVAGQTWRGNFYKCADESSHPHWAAWAPVDELNFHLPRCFGYLRFRGLKA